MFDNRGIINLKLGALASSISEDLLNMSIDEVTTVIKNYCNIRNIPEGLKYTHANMVVDLIKYVYTSTGGTTSSSGITAGGVVSSVKLGDMNLNITSSGSSDATAHKNALDDILMNYINQLNLYREIWYD